MVLSIAGPYRALSDKRKCATGACREPRTGSCSAYFPIIVFLCLLFMPARAASVAYTAYGDYALKTFQLGAGMPPGWTNSGSFEVQVDDCKWAISLHPNPVRTIQGPVVVVRHHLAAFDGETIYEFYAPEVSFDDPKDPRIPQSGSQGSGQMVNGPVPQRLDPCIQTVWLGLASGCYFGQRSPGYHQCLGLPPEDPQRHDNFRRVYVDWLMQPAEPHIPGWVAYIGREVHPGQTNGENDGHTNLWLHVGSWTNQASLSLPREFETSTFYETILSTTIHCSVTSVVARATTMEFVPRLDRPTSILDRRLTNHQPYMAIRYGLASNWPSMQVLARVDTAVRTHNSQSKPAKAPPTRRVVVLALFIGLSAAFFLWWYGGGGRPARRNTQ